MRPTFTEIRARFEAEQRAGGALRTAEDLPLSYEAITPGWLTLVLARNHPGAAVAACRLGEKGRGHVEPPQDLPRLERGGRAGRPSG